MEIAYRASPALEDAGDGAGGPQDVSAEAVVAASVRLENENNISKNQSDPLRLAMKNIIKLVAEDEGLKALPDKFRFALSLTLLEVG